jgi:hypothetical protein
MAEDIKQGQKAEKRPTLAVPVHVQCEGFRCLAYRDKTGAWVNYHSGELLKGTVRVIQYNADVRP